MFAGRRVINESIMNRRRAKALDRLILQVANDMLIHGKLLINPLYQRLPKVDRLRIRGCLRQNGFKEISKYTWEKNNAEESMGATRYVQR
jgi:hypothetical protein